VGAFANGSVFCAFVAACGGKQAADSSDTMVTPDVPVDLGVDAAGDTMTSDTSLVDVGPLHDGAPPDGPRFDAHDDPLPGMIPTSDGVPCGFGGKCPDGAFCAPSSGWCCAGQIKEGACICGSTLGCEAGIACCLRGAPPPVCTEFAKCPA
jgi:hypothetical protein